MVFAQEVEDFLGLGGLGKGGVAGAFGEPDLAQRRVTLSKYAREVQRSGQGLKGRSVGAPLGRRDFR